MSKQMNYEDLMRKHGTEEMNKMDDSQFLMCEKEDLVKYIEFLLEDEEMTKDWIKELEEENKKLRSDWDEDNSDED
jgi:hypothetical protein